MRSHIEDGHHGATAQWVVPAHLGDAIDGSPAAPEAQDPAGAGATTHLELDPSANLPIRALDIMRVAGHPRDEQLGHG
jgi:hypothetical protein